jgi:FdhE protein
MKTASAQKIVDSTLETIRKRVPAYEELANKFGPLFVEKAKLRDGLIAHGSKIPAIDKGRLAQGVPVLVDKDLSPWAEDMKMATLSLLPVLEEVLSLDKEVVKSLREHMAESGNLVGLAQARIEGNWKHFENTSVELGVDQTTLLYISETVFAPVLCAMVDSMGESLSNVGWEHGHCPVCGSSPSISYLSPKEVTDLDQLVGGGGKKFLHCSLCGHDWRFKRNACVSCGNDENESREVFYMDDVKFERVEACHKCGKYCLNVDMRECEPYPHLDAVQLGLIHLDIYAHKKDLSPITPTLWNSVE